MSGAHGALRVIQELRSRGLEETVKAYRLRAHRHATHPHLVQLHYDFQCKFDDEVHAECRGIIVDTSQKTFPIVCLPYTKFFNHGEKGPKAGASGGVDWKTATVVEKLDGSIATLYHYRGAWFVSSSSVPDGGMLLMASGMTFRDIFFEIWERMRYVMPSDTSKVYIFEMLTAKNRIICHVPEDKLVLHGVRCMNTLLEERPEPVAAQNNWECAPTHRVTSLAECLALVKDRPPFENEGVVVCDTQFRRLKIKSQSYTAVAHLNSQKHASNYQRMLHVVRVGESEELLAYHPHHRPTHDAVMRAYCDCVTELKREGSQRGLTASPLFASWVSRIKSKKVTPEVALRDADMKDAWELVSLFMKGGDGGGGGRCHADDREPKQKQSPVVEEKKKGIKGQPGKKKADHDLPDCTGVCCVRQPSIEEVPAEVALSVKKKKKKKKGRSLDSDDDDGDTAPPELVSMAPSPEVGPPFLKGQKKKK